ncbi:hypothetical protein TrRE_jg11023 [Triparma retinervis]|jgi:histidine ammonia-lyase|uniref:Histidine ammonia-lyase n=1 Tax=Triparma retinervis TaxID=2557542 RepID=A0A9W7CMJ7_9STRA|nr:hypothetical protein TrRE_jg11023 [Triparma retinervis]
MSKPVLYLDGYSLTPKELFGLQSGNVDIALTPEAEERIKDGREVVDKIVESQEVVYGINTGFGLFSNVTVSPDKLGELQVNLIRSHSSGVGEPLSPQRTRMLLALRINVLAKGHSGIGLVNVLKMIKAFNAGCMPMVPCKGTVGASGDLAPLSHLALGLMGEGKMFDPETGELQEAADVLKKHNLEPIILGAKEGLAMINGTQLIAALGSEAVSRSFNVARCADVATAFSLEVLCGTVRAYHPLIHKVRPHVGQQVVATRIRTLLQPDSPSGLFQSHQYIGKVQDAYSLRCAPQVHGICNDTIEFVNKLLTTELNSATDNPMVFTAEQVKNEVPFGFDIQAADPSKDSDKFSSEVAKQFEGAGDNIEDITDLEAAKKEIAALRATVAEQNKPKKWGFFKKTSDLQLQSDHGVIMSGGNFHGEYPAKALDYLAIGVHELSAISERRIERLVNPSLSGLPAFLVQDGGFNSGFMIAHCTAAALVSENKVLTHPASVDSISTSAAKEDHVSMGGFAARKALEVVDHVEIVIAIEVLCACQAMEFHRPLKTTDALEAVHKLVRSEVEAWDGDREMWKDINAVKAMIYDGRLWSTVEPFLLRSPS